MLEHFNFLQLGTKLRERGMTHIARVIQFYIITVPKNVLKAAELSKTVSCS